MKLKGNCKFVGLDGEEIDMGFVELEVNPQRNSEWEKMAEAIRTEIALSFTMSEMVCSYCNGTGKHLCADVAQPVVVDCTNKFCNVRRNGT